MTNSNPMALVPIGVFVAVYLGLGVIFEYVMHIPMGFYNIPIVVAFLISIFVGLLQNRKVSLDEKLDIMAHGLADRNIITMLLIFVTAGVFVGVVGRSSAESVAYCMLSIFPPKFAVAILFVVSCFVSTAMGTSVGTITLITPIACAVAQTSGFSLPLCVGSVMGGAMFVDNLSFISDTTIAATRTQGCEMKDKFKMNFKIVLPAAIITAFIFVLITKNGAVTTVEVLDYSLIKIVPYIAVIVGALVGLNVIAVLLGGVVTAGIIGFIGGSFDLLGFFGAIADGTGGMSELIIISILIAGTIEIIKYNGGIDFIINKGLRGFKSKMGAELGIAALVSLVDICTANNTVAIVTVGPIAKGISDEVGLEPKRVAGIMDMFSCVFQGVIPYGAQLISAAGLAALSPFAIMKYLFYPYLMGISAVIAIVWYHRKKNKNVVVKENKVV